MSALGRPGSAAMPGAALPSGYARAAFVMFCGAALTLVYMLLPGVHSVFHTWLSTLLVLVLVWGYVLHQQHGRLPLRSDTLVLGGFTLTHLLPPLYLTLRAGSPFVDQYGVETLQPQVALLTGMGAFLVLASFGAVHRRLGGTDAPIPAPSPLLSAGRALAVIVGAALTVAVARLYLLASGAYYWTYADEAFVSGRWYSVTSSISRYGLIVPIMLWLLAAYDRRWRMWAWMATAAELAWVVPSGARQALLETAAGFLLVVWWRNRRLPRGRVLVMLAVAIFTMPILGEYRTTIGLYSSEREVTTRATTRALWEARERVGLTGALEFSDRFIDRLYDGQFLGYLIKNYRKTYDWEYGATYTERLPYVFVPYFVGGGERPIMQVPLDRWFKLLHRGSNPSTLLGEGYANFGYPGIALAAVMLGAVLALYEAAFRRMRENLFIDAVYLLHASMLPYMVSAGLGHWLAFLRNALLMMLVVVVVTRVARAVRVRSTDPLVQRPA